MPLDFKGMDSLQRWPVCHDRDAPGNSRVYVGPGSILACLPGVSRQNLQDVLATTRLALSVADAATARGDTRSWSASYARNLAESGWMTPGLEWQSLVFPYIAFSVDEIVHEIALQGLTQDETGLLGEVIMRLQRLPPSHPLLQAFHAPLRPAEDGLMLFSTCTELDGSLLLRTIALRILPSEPCADLLCGHFVSEGTRVDYALVQQTLHAGVHVWVRDNVLARLEGMPAFLQAEGVALMPA